jgi:hypothetical protein
MLWKARKLIAKGLKAWRPGGWEARKLSAEREKIHRRDRGLRPIGHKAYAPVGERREKNKTEREISHPG